VVEARWVHRAVWGARRRPSPWSGPGGSVAVARRSVSPFAVGEVRWSHCFGFRLPGEPFAITLGPWIPLPPLGAPEGAFCVGWGVRGSFRCGSWARWVRRAVRGARRRPSPWSGPGGSVAVAPGSSGILIPWQG
jgi:hypothetical protein